MFTRYFYKMEEQGRQRTEDMKIELIVKLSLSLNL